MRWWNVAWLAALLAGCDDVQDAANAQAGEQTYNRYCFSCHAAGVAGAPRVGDPDAWAPRIAKGRQTLVRSAMTGVPPGMPPKGLCSDCDAAQLGAAIDYMIEHSSR